MRIELQIKYNITIYLIYIILIVNYEKKGISEK